MKKKFLPAIHGLINAFKDQGILIQMILGCGVILFGFLVHFSYMEWFVVLLAIGLVVGLEMINTCIERVCDLYSTEPNEKIEKIKDLAAGTVLFASILALVIFVIIMIHNVL